MGRPRLHENKYNQCFLQYHIAFFTQSDFPLLDHEVQFIKNYFNKVALRHEFKIVEMEFHNMSVIFTIDCQTTHFIPNIVKALKGGSTRFLYKEFPESKINHGDSLWDTKFIISTDKIKFEHMVQIQRTSLTS